MKSLTDKIVQFFEKQHFVIVSTVDKKGSLHNSCKGIVKINRNGKIYLLDLYMKRTFKNLKQNPHISITAVDERKFEGYSLKGKAKIIKKDRLNSQIMKTWEDKVTGRIAHRVLQNVGGQKGHLRHPEALLPKPTYMIVMGVEEVVDLTPRHIR
jgi:general stress protein 26